MTDTHSIHTANTQLPPRLYLMSYIFNINCSKIAADQISISGPPLKKHSIKYSASGKKSHGSPESVYSCCTLGELTGAGWREHFTVHSRPHQLNILLCCWRQPCSLWTPTEWTLLISRRPTRTRKHTHTHTHTAILSPISHPPTPQPLFPHAALSFTSSSYPLMGGGEDVNRQEKVKDSHSCPA